MEGSTSICSSEAGFLKILNRFGLSSMIIQYDFHSLNVVFSADTAAAESTQKQPHDECFSLFFSTAVRNEHT